MASIMLFYLLTAQSWYMRENANGKYLQAFRVYYLAAACTIVVDATCGVSAIVLSQQGETDELLLDNRGYKVVNGICQMAYGLQFASSTWSTAQVLQRCHWQLQGL
jgi:hypothetical protein